MGQGRRKKEANSDLNMKKEITKKIVFELFGIIFLHCAGPKIKHKKIWHTEDNRDSVKYKFNTSCSFGPTNNCSIS